MYAYTNRQSAGSTRLSLLQTGSKSWLAALTNLTCMQQQVAKFTRRSTKVKTRSITSLTKAVRSTKIARSRKAAKTRSKSTENMLPLTPARILTVMLSSKHCQRKAMALSSCQTSCGNDFLSLSQLGCSFSVSIECMPYITA